MKLQFHNKQVIQGLDSIRTVLKLFLKAQINSTYTQSQSLDWGL